MKDKKSLKRTVFYIIISFDTVFPFLFFSFSTCNLMYFSFNIMNFIIVPSFLCRIILHFRTWYFEVIMTLTLKDKELQPHNKYGGILGLIPFL